MSTPKLPFYEKDAKRWRDHLWLSVTELGIAIRNTYSPSTTTHLEAVLWQMHSIVNDIDKTLMDRRNPGASKK